jgi:hypothetical protein
MKLGRILPLALSLAASGLNACSRTPQNITQAAPTPSHAPSNKATLPPYSPQLSSLLQTNMHRFPDQITKEQWCNSFETYLRLQPEYTGSRSKNDALYTPESLRVILTEAIGWTLVNFNFYNSERSFTSGTQRVPMQKVDRPPASPNEVQIFPSKNLDADLKTIGTYLEPFNNSIGLTTTFPLISVTKQESNAAILKFSKEPTEQQEQALLKLGSAACELPANSN